VTQGRAFDARPRPLLEIDRNIVRVYPQSPSEATIDLVTMNGRRVKLLHQGMLPEGGQAFSLVNGDVPNGVYMLRRLAGDGVRCERRVVVNR